MPSLLGTTVNRVRRTCVPAMTIICLSVGCGGNDGPKLGDVTGTITMNGTPLSGVNVTFIPQEKGSPSYGATDEGGKYRLLFTQHRSGAELGKHHVVIKNKEPETDDSGNRILTGIVVTIPEKYGEPGALSTEVYPGQNKLDFALDAPVKP
jgi:hypothetical protein